MFPDPYSPPVNMFQVLCHYSTNGVFSYYMFLYVLISNRWDLKPQSNKAYNLGIIVLHPLQLTVYTLNCLYFRNALFYQLLLWFITDFNNIAQI
jgi:hypothetical protein